MRLQCRVEDRFLYINDFDKEHIMAKRRKKAAKKAAPKRRRKAKKAAPKRRKKAKKAAKKRRRR